MFVSDNLYSSAFYLFVIDKFSKFIQTRNYQSQNLVLAEKKFTTCPPTKLVSLAGDWLKPSVTRAWCDSMSHLRTYQCARELEAVLSALLKAWMGGHQIVM